MAIQGDGAGIQNELVAVGAGLPANTSSMCIAVHGRIDSDLNRLAGIACLVKYSGTPTGHMMIVDSDGTSLKLLSNYFESPSTDVVASLAVGTAYTMFIEGDGSDLVLSLIVEGSTTILSEATTQTAFVPERLYLFGTNSSGSNESADATAKWVGIWNEPLSDSEKRAVHLSGPSAKAGAITNRPFTGGSLSNALSAGTGAVFAVGNGGGISYVEWEGAPAPKVVTLTVWADVDLQGGTVPDPGTAPDITTTSLPSGQVGVPYSAQIMITGTVPITYGLQGLPDGLQWFGQAVSGGVSLTINGTPTGSGGLGGAYTVTVTAENDYGSDTANLSLAVADAGVAPPVITTEQLPEGRVGQSYSFTFTGSGAGPLSWEFDIPASGLTSSGPTVSGIPAVPGSYNIGARLTGAGGSSAWQFFPLTIRPSARRRRTASPWAATIRKGR